MRLVLPRAAFRPAVLLTFVIGLTSGSIPLTATAATPSKAQIHPATDVGLASQVTATRPSARAAVSPQHGARRLHPAVKAAALARTGLAPSAQSGSEGGSSGALLRRFNGVSSHDSAVTNFGAEFEPPDQGLCEGNGFVLEAVNSAYTIYRTNGTPIAGPFNVNDLFHRDPLAFTSDPRCYYDPSTNTWFAIILFLSTDANGNFTDHSSIDISVNPSGDPTKAWTTYSIDTSHANAPAADGCPCFGDQPRFGIDAFNLYLSTDEFSILGTQFNGAQLYAVSKRDLVQLRHRIHFAHFDNPTIGGNQLVAIEPATTVGPADAEYFLNALDFAGDGTVTSQIAVWAMTNRDEVGRGEAPTLSSVVINSEGYSAPPPAGQKGSGRPLDSGDDRMQQTQFIDGTLWGELATGLNIPGDGTTRAAAAWFNVKPSLDGEELDSATMTRQGYVGLRGNNLLYPAIQADNAGNAAMVVTAAGPGRFASAAFTTMRSGQPAFGPIRIAASGTGPYAPPSDVFGRWGDYSYASLDSATNSVWLATEYVPPVSSQTPDGINNWGTEVIQVSLGNNHQEG
jgi:hypothetical protein